MAFGAGRIALGTGRRPLPPSTAPHTVIGRRCHLQPLHDQLLVQAGLAVGGHCVLDLIVEVLSGAFCWAVFLG